MKKRRISELGTCVELSKHFIDCSEPCNEVSSCSNLVWSESRFQRSVASHNWDVKVYSGRTHGESSVG